MALPKILILGHSFRRRLDNFVAANPNLDHRSKDLSNRPIYAVLNTYNLDMILQLKYMPIVMNPGRIASGDWKS